MFEGGNDDNNVASRLGVSFEELDEVMEEFDNNEIDDDCLEQQEKMSLMENQLALRVCY